MEREEYIDIINCAMGLLVHRFTPIQIGNIIDALMNAYNNTCNSEEK